MRKMTQRFIAVLLALCAVTAFAIEESANNKGMYIQRTIHPDDDANQGFLQLGGVAVTPETPTSNAPYTVAFWMRRKTDNLALTSPTGGVGLAMASVSYSGEWTGEPTVQSADLPDDEEWHYFVIQYDGTGRAWVYRDAALLGQIGAENGVYRFGYGCLGAPYAYIDVPFVRGDYKGPTVFSTIVDDLSIWNTNSPAVLQIHNDIFKYGMRAMPDTHPDRLNYFSCDSAVDALQYFQDQAINHPGVTGDDRAYSATRSTAAFIDANVLKGVTNKPIQWVRMTVESDYGPDKVDPVVQTAVDRDYQQQVTFTAPASVYLDRYFNELTVTPGNEDAIEKMAYYRADCIGYDVDGPQFQGDGSLTSFVVTLTDDITVVWKWELKYLVGVDSATGSHADAGLDPGVGSPSPQVGFGFEKASADGGPARVGSIDGSIGGISVPVRFKSRGYILENTPGATERSFVLGAGGDYLRLQGDNLGQLLGGTRTDFTVDFWARRDAVGATADQAVVSIGDPGNGGFQIGFEKNSETGNGFGGNAFYVKNLKTNFHVTAPEAFSDHEWHHWAVVWVRDGAGSGDLRIYRDGGLVVGTNETDAPKIYLANGSGFATIGRDIWAGEPFSGGVNNLRIWDTERTSTQIEASMETESYGDDQGGELVVELGFDTPNLTAVTSTEGRSLTFTL